MEMCRHIIIIYIDAGDAIVIKCPRTKTYVNAVFGAKIN